MCPFYSVPQRGKHSNPKLNLKKLAAAYLKVTNSWFTPRLTLWDTSLILPKLGMNLIICVFLDTSSERGEAQTDSSLIILVFTDTKYVP